LDHFRELLEENGFSMSSSQHLRELIPMILEEERNKICNQIKDREINIFSRSPKTKLNWKTVTGLPTPPYSTTRWWSKWEIQLQIELAVTVDAGEPFVRATYYLEGDGPLVFSCYEKILELKERIATAYYPNTNVVIRKLAKNDNTVKKQLEDYSKSCAQPGYAYFNTKFNIDLKDALLVFKVACYFDPVKVTELQPRCCDINDLKALKFLAENNNTIDSLKRELPVYLSKASGISNDTCKLRWWNRHSSQLPYWSKVCKSLLLLQPSSAAAERIH
uniref:HAT C-terminal dimerisation domain-containing protein n=1 Tax=Amphimedon queenslandica TaxID=400682 RepID=A0A1X7T8Q5_AMPQE